MPAEQTLHAPPAEYLPAAQSAQDPSVAPASEPATQSVQVAEPAAALVYPAGQAEQDPVPAEDVMPCSHGVQAPLTIVVGVVVSSWPATHSVTVWTSQPAPPVENFPAAQAAQATAGSADVVPSAQTVQVLSVAAVPAAQTAPVASQSAAVASVQPVQAAVPPRENSVPAHGVQTPSATALDTVVRPEPAAHSITVWTVQALAPATASSASAGAKVPKPQVAGAGAWIAQSAQAAPPVEKVPAPQAVHSLLVEVVPVAHAVPSAQSVAAGYAQAAQAAPALDHSAAPHSTQVAGASVVAVPGNPASQVQA